MNGRLPVGKLGNRKLVMRLCDTEPLDLRREAMVMICGFHERK